MQQTQRRAYPGTSSILSRTTIFLLVLKAGDIKMWAKQNSQWPQKTFVSSGWWKQGLRDAEIHQGFQRTVGVWCMRRVKLVSINTNPGMTFFNYQRRLYITSKQTNSMHRATEEPCAKCKAETGHSSAAEQRGIAKCMVQRVGNLAGGWAKSLQHRHQLHVSEMSLTIKDWEEGRYLYWSRVENRA